MEVFTHLYCTFCIIVALLLCHASADKGVVKGDCLFTDYVKPHKSMNRIESLIGKSYSTKNGSYSYVVGICKKISGDTSNAAVMQTEVTTHKEFVLGQVNKADIMEGDDWLFLEYHGGTTYGSHCNHSERRVYVMISCNRTEKEGMLRLLDEQNQKSANCYYLFQLEHAAACLDQNLSKGLSVGSVLCVIFICIVALYLLGGFAYQRLVVGAKGFEQIPNYAFWVDFGNLQADGCNFLCRCGGGDGIHSGQRLYRGIGDDQLQDDDDDTEDADEHLLPM